MNFASVQQALHLAGVAIGAWALLSTLEWFAAWRELAHGRLMGWDLRTLRRGRIATSKVLRALYVRPVFAALLGLRLVAALVLLAWPLPVIALAALGVIVVISLLLALRLPVSDGADKMGIIAACANLLLAVGLLSHDITLCFAGSLWAGGQLTIAYVTSGSVKLVSPSWRDGSVLPTVMASHYYGHDGAARLVASWPRGARLFCALVIIGEIFFPLALFLPREGLLVVLAGFGLFHLAIAAIMGLNTYFLAFISTYPALLLLSTVMRRALGLG